MPGRNDNVGKYRFGFNGKESDDEIKGLKNSLNFDARIYDPRLGRFLSIDPDEQKYPYASPYLYASNCPIRLIDVNGKGPGDVMQGFVAAMADYGSGGLTNFRNWTEVKPENASDFNKGLQIADALMIALATAEIVGGSGTAASGLLTMQAGVATLIVPGIGEVTFVVAEVGGGAITLAGTLVASHGAAMLKMASDNVEENNGYRSSSDKKLIEEAKAQKAKEQKSTNNKERKEAQTQRGNSREGNSNQSTKGSHHSSNKGGDKHSKGDSRRAKDQGLKGPDTTK